MFVGSWEPELIPQLLRCKWRKEIWNFSDHLVEVEAKGRSLSASPIGFRSWHGEAILGWFCLFFSYPRLFHVCVHNQTSTIRAPRSCCRGPGANPTSPCLHCLLGHRGAGDKTKRLAAWWGAPTDRKMEAPKKLLFGSSLGWQLAGDAVDVVNLDEEREVFCKQAGSVCNAATRFRKRRWAGFADTLQSAENVCSRGPSTPPVKRPSRRFCEALSWATRCQPNQPLLALPARTPGSRRQNKALGCLVRCSHRQEDGGTQKAPFWLLVGLAAGGRCCWRGKLGWGERGVL